MSNKSITLTDEIHDYLLSVSLREPEILRELRSETAADPMCRMQISPEQGQFMALLVRLMGATRGLEIGVFTGYSALWVAMALPAQGKLTACDISEPWTSVAQRYWQLAGIADKIDLRLGPALQTLDGLLADGQASAYDFAFIDADKENYDGYYERALQLLRPRGLVLIDNVLWDGRVADERFTDDETQAIRALNEKIHRDPRVTLSLIPVADGLTLALKN